jgi:hypothetical protein
MFINLTQRCDSAFQKSVLLKCYDALSAAGFVRFRREGVDWPFEGGFHCWVWLDTDLRKDHLAINPFVGVHVVPIMKFCAALECRRYSRTVSTYALDMGELTSFAPVFRFTRHSDVYALVARLVRLYTSVGMVYAKSIANYELLLPLLQSRVGMLAQYPERTAACLYLMGRKEEARLFTEKFLAQYRAYFEGFAAPFTQMLDRQSANEVTRPRIRARSARAPAPKQHARNPSTMMSDDIDFRNNNNNRHTSFH